MSDMDPLCPPTLAAGHAAESRTHRRSLRERPCDVLYVHAIEQVASRDRRGQGAYHIEARELSRTSAAYAYDARQPAAKGGHGVTRFGMWRIPEAPPRTAEAVGRVCTRRRAAVVGGWKPGCPASSICACDLRGRTASPTTILVSRTSSPPSRRAPSRVQTPPPVGARIGRDASDEGREPT